MKRAIVVIAAVLAWGGVSYGRIITVDDDGLADFNTIQAAIDDSNDGDTVLVADGIYTGAGNRDIDFHGKAITVRSENGPENCIIDCNGSETNKHRGFHFHSGEDCDSALIGFTITNGYPPGECRPVPPFPCFYLGGAIRCKEASPTISHCIITGNWAKKGGGIYFEGGAPKVSNCTIAGNHAVDWGGGIAVNSSDAEISNCIIWGNSAPSGPQIYNSGSGSPTVAYSDVQGGWAGAGNIDADPCFADPNNGDYHLKSQAGRWDPNSGDWVIDEVTSLCIDAGDPMTPISLETFPNGGRINMGAYGGTGEASKSYFGQQPCGLIVAGDVNGDCTVNFLDFRIMALHWLESKDAIEYYIQTDKAVYNLGENVEILYSVTNMSGNPVDIGMVLNCYYWCHFMVTDDHNTDIWQHFRIIPPCGDIMFSLDAYESRECQISWDMISDNGTFFEHDDDYPVGPGSYNITGELERLDGGERFPVSVSIIIL